MSALSRASAATLIALPLLTCAPAGDGALRCPPSQVPVLGSCEVPCVTSGACGVGMECRQGYCQACSGSCRGAADHEGDPDGDGDAPGGDTASPGDASAGGDARSPGDPELASDTAPAGGDATPGPTLVSPGLRLFVDPFWAQGWTSTGAYSWGTTSPGRQSGRFEVTIDVIADVMSDGDAGVLFSDGTDPLGDGYSWEDFAARVRFSSGRVQARHISDYCPEGPVPPCDAVSVAPRYVGLDQLGGGQAKRYRFRLVIDYPAGSYDAYVRNVTDAVGEESILIGAVFSADWTEGPNDYNSASGLSAWSAWPDIAGTATTGQLYVGEVTVLPLP